VPLIRLYLHISDRSAQMAVTSEN